MGRFHFNRLPFGLNLAQDVFQHHMDIMLEDLNGIINIADDIIVYGHDKHLLALFHHAREYGLVFNKNAYFQLAKYLFFCLIYSKSGMMPDPKRTLAISRIPPVVVHHPLILRHCAVS